MNSPINATTFGVVEGFYGVFYTFPQRLDMIRFIGSHGYNIYLYAPKNDRQHRIHWREAYPPHIMEQFAVTIETARQNNIDFTYGISPGLSISYHSSQDFECLTAKLSSFFNLGVRSFSLMLDDTQPEFQFSTDQQEYATLALAQADLANRLYEWLVAQDPSCHMSFCPVDYYGAAPFSSALHQLGAALHSEIEIFYTGREICSPSITAADVQAFSQAVRRPTLLWDNYPVNDLGMASELHLGPIDGRDPSIKAAVSGIFVNLMIQPEASKIPLLTYASWMHSEHYEPEASWETALHSIVTEGDLGAVRIFSRHSMSSFIDINRQPALSDLVTAVMDDLQHEISTSDSVSMMKLEAYLNDLDVACYHIKFRMENLALRQDLLPWIEIMEHWIWMTRRAITVIRSIETGQHSTSALNSMLEYQALIQHHSRQVPLEPLMPLIRHALDQDQKLVSSQPAHHSLKIRLPRLTIPRLSWKKSGKPV
jgi:hyaluronoglucosaminidase